MSRTITSTQNRLITGEDLARISGLDSCELIDGRIVPMTPTSPEHGRVEGNIFRILDAFVRPRGLGKLFVGEVGIYTQRNPDRVRAADALFVTNETYACRSDQAAYLDVAPELVVEILSPNDTVMDLTEKLREYFAIGVKLVWVPDPRARRVMVFRSLTDVRELTETDQLSGDDVLPGFAVSVAALFEE
jgi:Uma2 family endonuclease